MLDFDFGSNNGKKSFMIEPWACLEGRHSPRDTVICSTMLPGLREPPRDRKARTESSAWRRKGLLGRLLDCELALSLTLSQLPPVLGPWASQLCFTVGINNAILFVCLADATMFIK